MKPHELLELAALDTLGLLDPAEREEFEGAFRAADPALQAQVRREQLRITSAQATLPAVEPPLGLRARVLAAVREAMQSVASRKAGATGAASFRRPIGVNSFWRIGAIGSLAAAVVFGVVAFEMRANNRLIQDALTSNQWNDQVLKEYGYSFDRAFFSPTTRMVTFAPAREGLSHGKATLLWDPQTKRGQIYCKDLPADQGEYEVVLVDKAGRAIKAIITFPATPAGVKNSGTIDGIDMTSQSIAIRRVGSDEMLLRSQGM